jgi:GNAT superfamily N-acetyltransferase
MNNQITISTDTALLDIEMIHDYLANKSYWSPNIPLSTVRKSIEYSLCFGVYTDGEQIGFARVISDFTTFAYLADVFVLPDWQRRGIGGFLMSAIKSHPGLQNLKRWILVTQDAHGLYKKFGFTGLAKPENMMELK